MVLATIETMTKADPVWRSRGDKADVAAQASAGESFHAGSPLKPRDRELYTDAALADSRARVSATTRSVNCGSRTSVDPCIGWPPSA
jgi:hypothetical protein